MRWLRDPIHLYSTLSHAQITCQFQGKLIGEEWKKLGDDDKEEWNAKAEADKVRYKKEMEGYSPPSDDDDSDDDSDDGGKKQPAKKKAKKGR